MGPLTQSTVSNTIQSTGSFFRAPATRIVLIAVAALALLALACKYLYNQYQIAHSPSFQVKMATWNIGGLTDFIRSLPSYQPQDLPVEWGPQDSFPTIQTITQDQMELWQTRRIELIKTRIEAVAADVFALQEIHQDDIDAIGAAWFADRNYTIITDERDAAVLYRHDLFTEIARNIQVRGRNSVKVTLRHNQSQQNIAVGSAHITGFSLGDPEAPYGMGGKEYDQGDGELTHFVNELTANASVHNVTAATFLGSDINSNESVHPERIGIVTNQHFRRDSRVNDGQTTAFNPHLREAQLDHLFSLSGRRCRDLQFTADPLPPHIMPPSDHKTVSGTYTIRYTPN